VKETGSDKANLFFVVYLTTLRLYGVNLSDDSK
jgi:hypothetical protein